MTDMQDTLKQIVSRSSMIYERLSPSFEPASEQDPERIAFRIEKWKEALDIEGKGEILEKTMLWEGLDENKIRRMVGRVCIADSATLPEWAQTLGEALLLAQEPDFWQDRTPAWLRHVDEGSEGETGAVTENRQPVPFEELHLPFLEIFRNRITANPGYSMLSERPRQAIWRKLLVDLANRASEAFYHDFRSFRDRQAFGPLTQVLARSGKRSSRSLYLQYIRNMQSGGLVAFLTGRPVLARLLAILTHSQAEAQNEFLQRLYEDQEQIALAFGNGQLPGKVTELAMSLSDPHQGGRSVVRITFESGLQLVYKPKDLGIATAYNDLLAWLDDHGSPVYLRPLQHRALGDHGWVEYARHDPCGDLTAAARYYRRVGALLCLMYTLEATDCHLENLIAGGEHPVLIDNETIFHHRVPEEAAGETRESAVFKARIKINHSVLQVGLLPGYNVGKDPKNLYDISGLGGEADQISPSRRLVFAFTNTDAMEIVFEQGKLPQAANRPYLEGGVPVPMEDFIDDLDQGFREMYVFLMKNRHEMLQPGGPLQAFKNRQVRFIFRPTQVYVSLSNAARRPNNLQDGVDYSLYLERLARAFLLLEHRPSWYALLAAERRALYALDVPYFTASTGSVDLETGVLGQSDTIWSYFIAPSYDLAVERLLSLSEEDLEFQSQVVQVSMRCRQAEKLQEKAKRVPPDYGVLRKASHETLDGVGLVGEAVALADRLVDQAVRGEGGSVAWYGPQYMKEANRYQYSVLGISLYDGMAGAGLFLAALDKILRLPDHRASFNPSYRELALASLKPVSLSLSALDFDNTIKAIGLGGAYGLGGLLYTLARCAGLLEEPALLDDAQAAVLRINPGRLAEDNIYGVMDGSAGAMLCLLAVYRATRQPEALERAVDCGKHLLQKSAPAPSEAQVRGEASGHSLTGFLEGTEGIAYALLRLYRATGDETIRSAAETGMGRIRYLSWLDAPQVTEDIEVDLQTALRNLEDSPDRSDSLWGGNMGSIELLLSAGLRLDRSDWVEEALQEASRLADTARREGGYRTNAFLKRGNFSPGFFQGASGIGYQLLRLAYPLLLPNVLLWE
jgi:type 2 lantibiotic biosynthesis protein LanM